MEELTDKRSMEKICICIDNAEKYIDTLCMIIHNTPEEDRDEQYCKRLLSRAAEVREAIVLLKRTYTGELK